MKPITPMARIVLNTIVLIGLALNMLRTGCVRNAPENFRNSRRFVFISYQAGMFDKGGFFDKMREEKLLRPPNGILIDLLLPPERAEETLVNILGRYDYWVQKHGPRKARIVFWSQTFGAIITFWADWAMKRVALLNLLRRS